MVVGYEWLKLWDSKLYNYHNLGYGPQNNSGVIYSTKHGGRSSAMVKVLQVAPLNSVIQCLFTPIVEAFFFGGSICFYSVSCSSLGVDIDWVRSPF